MSFFGIRLAGRALQTHQRAMETTGQNIANVDTPGYNRQIAILRPVSGPGAFSLDRSGAPIARGGGVDVATIFRTHAAWLDEAATALGAQVSLGSVRERYSGQIESLLAEPTDAGLQATLDRFFVAFGHVADRPDEMTARVTATRAGSEVAIRFQQLTRGLDQVRRDLAAQARENVGAINRITTQIVELFRVIRQAQTAGAAPNELLDQRDQLLDELTRRAGVTISGRDSGELIVSIGGHTILQGPHARALELAPDGSLDVRLQDSSEVIPIPGGELRALQEWNDGLLPGYQARFERLRDQFAAAVNALHTSGTDLTGAAGEPFFVADSKGDLSVNPVLLADPRRVVAGDGTAGDGRIALAIATLRTSDRSILPAYQSLVGDIGTEANSSRRIAEQSRASLHQVEALQASESGVNLDEELAQMVALQHVYSASARLLTTYDEMLDTLIQTGA